MSGRDTLVAILELARWAPSGDNSQPWTFRIVADDRIQIVGVDHAESDVYDFDGRPTLLTLGFLLETVAIAASKFALRIEWAYRSDTPHIHLIDVLVIGDAAIEPDALLPYLELRSVERGRYRKTALTVVQQTALQSSIGDALEIRWLASTAEKWQISRINMQATHIRLSIPEAFSVHQRILDWQNNESPHGVPSAAIGLDPMTLGSMQWVMQKWERAHFMNRFAGGTVVPRLEMDMVPGLMCAAHFMIYQRTPDASATPERLLRIGRSLQRFWLTATALGLVMQPSLAPLCFSYYAQHKRAFTTHPAMLANAAVLNDALQACANPGSRSEQPSGEPARELVFMGRIGTPLSMARRPRSIRKPLSALLQD